MAGEPFIVDAFGGVREVSVGAGSLTSLEGVVVHDEAGWESFSSIDAQSVDGYSLLTVFVVTVTRKMKDREIEILIVSFIVRKVMYESAFRIL